MVEFVINPLSKISSMALILHSGNRLETLSEKLADLLRASPLPPMEPETIVVQSRGMARWIAMSLAQHLGAWANACCPFPNTFISEMYRKILPDQPASSVKESREIMIWVIMGLLENLGNKPIFQPLNNYISEGGGIKRFQLAVQLADQYDQYMIYRPDFILQWEAGAGDSWQAQLWREIAARTAKDHRASQLHSCLNILRSKQLPANALPRRVVVFGISSMPPYHLKVFEALSAYTQVHFFLLNPCREYWADVLSEKERGRLRKLHGKTDDQLFLEKGNPLLSSMGRLGRDLFTLIHEYDCLEEDCFTDPGNNRRLFQLQSDILNLCRMPPGADFQDDDSIIINSCHSPMREVEILQDHLLHLFQKYPDLLPRDIIVMAPDLEKYGLLVQAVFDTAKDDPLRIPYTIADRSFLKNGGITETFFAMLALAGGRFGVSQVLPLLDCAAVRRKFKLNNDDIESIETWVAEVKIRWGLDEESRRSRGLPGFKENTWEAGLDRLLLGYAFSGGDKQLFAGILPYEYMEGTASSVLGRFMDLFQKLVELDAYVKKSHNLAQWSRVLAALLEECFEPGEGEESEILLVRGAFEHMRFTGAEADFSEEVDRQVVDGYLKRVLGEDRSGSGFLSGAVTFCALLPMRAVPAKIICLLGMNDGDFPRISRKMSFDLMAQSPLPGDRSVRFDDKYLFLESILSARKQLYISYVGQSAQNGRRRPPSVLVTELIDYFEDEAAGGKDSCPEMITEHRLQAFDPEYYRQNGRLRSFSPENYQAALAAVGDKFAAVSLVEESLKESSESRELAIEQLKGFFVHPARFFCQNRLGIYLPGREDMTDDIEPFDLAGLDRYIISEELLERYIQDKGQGFFESARASGVLPPGAVGQVAYHEMQRQVNSLYQNLGKHLSESMSPLTINLELGGFTITGVLSGITASGLVRFRSARISAKDMIKAWIDHLLLNFLQPQGVACQTLIVGTDGMLAFSPLADPERILQELLNLYLDGLRRPVHFFPQTSQEYAKRISEGKEISAALEAAQGKWLGTYYPGEGTDQYYGLCFKDKNPLDRQFMDLAEQIFEPLLASMENFLP
ncbi:MAG: exodeoxyribonuclease V subunit gamma [Proteobacteria bacterium]|nr:exodeoxyribonuclease V subunit gamma [Pseudomonadota bacterium]MBU1709907.1 exodeoxyribonuclease V subunit gamma [Pseudomonadota bacterium]